MERKTLKELHRDLSWSTRIYTLLTIVLVIGAHVFKAWESDWAMTIVVALAVVLLVESFAIVFHRYPNTWRLIRWGLLLMVLALLFIGFRSM